MNRGLLLDSKVFSGKKSYRKRGKFKTRFLTARQFLKSTAGRLDCLLQARGCRTRKDTLHQACTLSIGVHSRCL